MFNNASAPLTKLCMWQEFLKMAEISVFVRTSLHQANRYQSHKWQKENYLNPNKQTVSIHKDGGCCIPISWVYRCLKLLTFRIQLAIEGFCEVCKWCIKTALYTYCKGVQWPRWHALIISIIITSIPFGTFFHFQYNSNYVGICAASCDWNFDDRRNIVFAMNCRFMFYFVSMDVLIPTEHMT